MQKVYLLLRHNQQQGPFALSELLALPLQPTDLIWVEGKSTAWSYPSEIRELQPYLHAPDTTDNSTPKTYNPSKTGTTPAQKEKKVFVSLPAQQKGAVPSRAEADPLEQKAEAIRQRALAHSAAATATEQPALQTKLNRSLDDLAEDYAQWTLKTQKKNKAFTVNRPALLTAVLLLVITAGLWWLLAGKEAAPPVPQEQVAGSQPVSSAPPIQVQEEDMGSGATEQSVTTAERKTNKDVAAPAPISGNKNDLPQVASSADVPQVDESSNGADAAIRDEAEETVAAPEQKRKTIGQTIGGFFEKLKGKNGEEETGSAETGERRAKKRTEATDAGAATQDITQQVKLSANVPATSWMLGVKGLQLTLYNQSKLPLQTAVVQIKYYDEEESLLDEKTLEFSNIKPGQKMTLPAPEHRLASFTRQQVVTATGRVE